MKEPEQQWIKQRQEYRDEIKKLREQLETAAQRCEDEQAGAGGSLRRKEYHEGYVDGLATATGILREMAKGLK